MENLNNELSKLIELFEFHQTQNKGSSKKIKEEPLKENKILESKDLNYYDEKTKKLIDGCKELYKDELSVKDEDLFFSKDKYERLLRSKLIEGYKKHKSYERPNITVLELLDCPRKIYYERCKYEIDIDKLFKYPYVYLHQKVGIAVHDAISEVYDFQEIKKKIISEKYKVKGEVDAIKEDVVYEIKTIKINDFQNTYIDKHYYQGLIYAYILNIEYSYKIKKVCLLYQFKEHLDVSPKVFVLEVNNKIAESLLNRAIILHNCLEKKIVPEAVPSDEECKYCLFSDYCKKDGICIKKVQEQKQENKTIFLL